MFRQLDASRGGLAVGIALSMGVCHAALALPSGGNVVSGRASISPIRNDTLTINQSSKDAIINWENFSIGSSGVVQFNNGSGTTLNRVTSASISQLDGVLSATGSIYLINPNGIIIGRFGEVNVGGSFVGSTLDLPDNTLNKPNRVFSSASTASILNLGQIGALGGDVVLMASNVTNKGAISAPNGDVGLLAGTTVLLRDKATDDGKFSVELGGAGTSAGNRGAISAAMVELRANGGNVYALAGNTSGVISATGVSTNDGKVFLVAGGGEAVAHGVITATQADGSGGQVTALGDHLVLTNVSVSTGDWILKQGAFALTPSRVEVLAANLANTGVTLEATGIDGATFGGDIVVSNTLSWSGDNSFTLAARHNVIFQDGVTLANGDGAAITLAADNEGRGLGAVLFGAGASVSAAGPVTIFYNTAGDDRTSVNSFSYTNPTDYSANVSAGSLTSYMLVNTVNDLQNIQNNLSGTYALARNIDASSTVNWNGGTGFTPIGISYTVGFTGTLDGLGHSIGNLSINGSALEEGLFGVVNRGTLRNLTLKNESVTALGSNAAGGLVGDIEGGTISNTSSSGVVSGNAMNMGGLVGFISSAKVSNSSSSAAVTNSASSSSLSYTGGLVGTSEGGSIDGSFASGAVLGPLTVGGFVGNNTGSISNSFASGSVTSTTVDGTAGGFVGFNQNTNYSSASGTIQTSYSTGPVSGIIGAEDYVGGFAGVNSGNIFYAYTTGAVTGGNAGGFVGSNNQPGDIFQVYATGPVTSGGGLAGQSGGSITSSYWDIDTTGQIKAVSGYYSGFNEYTGIGASIGLNPYSQSTYSEFNFSSTGPWTIVEGASRPTLKALN